MAESTLSIAFYELANEVSNFLGYGSDLLKIPNRDLDDETRQQRDVLTRVMKSGLRQFYFPPPLAGDKLQSPTDWSFLHPTSTVVLQSGARSLVLPDDFGGVEGEITIAPSTTLVWWPIQLRNEGYVRAQYAMFPAMTSRPLMAALSPVKGTTATAGQRTELLIFPQADQEYQLQLQYYILPNYLDGSLPYAYGGAQHAETLLESCLAIAEQKIDDAAGVHTQKFMERLAASIGMDRKSKSQNLGYNGDRSDSRWRGYAPWWHYSDRIKVNGHVY